MKRVFSITLSLVLLSSFFFCGFSMNGQVYAEADERYSVGIMPMGGVSYYDVTTHYNYAYRVVDEYYNPRGVPSYAHGGASACAVSAGAVAMGYFDWDYDELIPNHTRFVFMGYEFYGGHGAGVDAMIADLYSRMGTTSTGTTIAGYLSGMEGYVEDKDLSIDQTSAMSNGSLSMTAYKSALQNGKLMSVFLSGFGVISFHGLTSNGGTDTVIHSVFTGNHVMMAYGYCHIKYYDASDNLINELQLLAVNTTLHNPITGYVNLAQYGTVNDAYITEVY